ncbi:MAG: hypothetical protein HY791_22175 [Deltaproteobacteria bacterium]|nr:hypothetical protein [Deltaproteobacteria bacterium]
MVAVRRLDSPAPAQIVAATEARLTRAAGPKPKLEVGLAPQSLDNKPHPRSRVTSPAEKGILAGLAPRAVTGVLLGASAFGALAGAAPAHAETIVPETTGTMSERDARAFADAAARLEAARDRMTPRELENARRELWAMYARADSIPLVGRSTNAGVETRGDVRMRELTQELERRMRVTAYDMAHPETLELVDGAPSYKKIDESVVRSLVLDALRDIPLNELPGGSALAQIIRSIPGASNIDAEHMSMREIEKALGREAKQLLDTRFGQFIQDHKIEVGIAGFATVTAARWASPEVARALDRVIPRIKLYEVKNDAGTLRAGLSARYRDARVLPDMDINAMATRNLGPVTLRADLRATLSIENDEHVSGWATVGARVGNENRWADLTGTVNHRGSVTTNLNLGLRQPDEGLNLNANVFGRFGNEHSVGNSGGRMGAEVNLTRDVRIGNARGDFGVYASHERDFDGRNEDTRAGLMFRLRW